MAGKRAGPAGRGRLPLNINEENIMNSAPHSSDNAAFWTTRYGLVKSIDATNPAARSLKQYGEWAEKEIDLLGSWIQEGQHVLEVGGEYGSHTLWLAQAVGSSGQVHVAEPCRLAFQLLCANVAINGLDNVYTHARWLGRAEQEVAATDVPCALMHGAQPDERFQVTTVDALDLGRMDLLKSNVPGALLDLLAGATETLRRCRPLIYARLTGITRAEEEVRAIKELGYRCWSHTPHLYNAGNFNKEGNNIFPGCVWQNVIAAPTEGRFELDPSNEL